MSVILSPLEVARGVSALSVRTPTIPPATHTNTFVLGTREIVLVEPASPYPEEIDRIVDWVGGYVAAGHVLCGLLLTHHHPDHVGGAARLREQLGVPLMAHGATRDRLAGKVTVDRVLEHGECIELDGPTPVRIEVIHTPGHAPGHLCFLESNSRALIAGDMIAGVGTILIEPTDGDMQAYLASLQQLDDLDSHVLLPAHGFPITNARERLRFYVQHRLAREAKVLAAVVALQGECALDAIVAEAYADTPSAAHALARLSAEAHLIKLAREGKVVRRQERWLAAS
jgi:endoribonuclease LACTB2